MHQIVFSPVTFQIQLSLPENSVIQRWGDILNYYFSLYAKELCNRPDVYIGHIKAIAILQDQEYIRYSKFKLDIAADLLIKGQSLYKTIAITVNSLVYGVTEEDSLRTMKYVAEKLEREFLLETTFIMERSGRTPHQNKHSHQVVK